MASCDESCVSASLLSSKYSPSRIDSFTRDIVIKYIFRVHLMWNIQKPLSMICYVALISSLQLQYNAVHDT